MVYVQREAGLVTGVFANFNEGVTEPEPLADDHPDVLAFRARMEPRPFADAMPLIIGGLHARIEALEARTDAEVLHILTTSGDPPDDMVADADDEDPGEQPEIFDEEDVAAGEAYPGIAILPDELGARRNAVLAAITTEKLTRLAIAMDPSRADFLAARFADYNNAGALGLPIDDALAADYRAFQELRDRRDRLTNYAMQLEQSALDGDMDRLEAMHAGLSEGWPT